MVHRVVVGGDAKLVQAGGSRTVRAVASSAAHRKLEGGLDHAAWDGGGGWGALLAGDGPLAES